MIKALQIIAQQNINSAQMFAHLMWPESEVWKSTNSRRKRGLYMSAASLLTKLNQRGFVTGEWWLGNGCHLTDQGKAELAKQSN